MAIGSVEKRGRGRPRNEKPIEQVVEVKRKRGRPRKNPINTEQPAPKKRGRPRKNPIENIVEEVSTEPVKVGKLKGYCPHCVTSISTLDNVEDREGYFYCYRCRKDIKESKLLESKDSKDSKEQKATKYKSKKEYLEDCLQASTETITPSQRNKVNIKDGFGDIFPDAEDMN